MNQSMSISMMVMCIITLSVMTGSCLAANFAVCAGGVSQDQYYEVQEVTGGGYIGSGGTITYAAGNLDTFTALHDLDGFVVWAVVTGGSGQEISNTVQQSLDGGFLIGGSTYSYGAGDLDCLLIKLAADGSLSWAKTIGESDAEDIESLIATDDGGCIAEPPIVLVIRFTICLS